MCRVGRSEKTDDHGAGDRLGAGRPNVHRGRTGPRGPASSRLARRLRRERRRNCSGVAGPGSRLGPALTWYVLRGRRDGCLGPGSGHGRKEPFDTRDHPLGPCLVD